MARQRRNMTPEVMVNRALEEYANPTSRIAEETR